MNDPTLYPNPAAPEDPDTALIPTIDLADLPPDWYAIPYTYTVIERTTPSDVQ